jgi:Protein of unknown function (DUF3515)
VSDAVTRSAARLALFIALPIALVAGLGAFWALGGFGTAAPGTSRTAPGAPGTSAPGANAPVAMPARSLPPSEATMCLAFVAHLPATVRGLAQRPVTAGHEQNAAYGEPPIKISCGGRSLPSTAPDAVLWTLSGICWYADQSRPDTTTWTTLDRRAPVTVTLPNSYQGQGGWVQEFTGPIREWVPSLPRLPKGCQAPSTAPS